MPPAIRGLTDYASFGVLVLAAWIEGWKPGELAWGLWVSSFFMVMVWLVVMTIYLIRADGGRVFKAISTLFGGAVMVWMLIWAFRFYGDLLDFVVPLIPDPGRIDLGGGRWRNVRPFELWPTLLAGVQEFYVVILVSLYPLIHGIRRTWPNADKFRMSPGFAPGGLVRLHFSVMALIGLELVFKDEPGRHVFMMSVVLLAIDSFPWHRFTRQANSAAVKCSELGSE